MRHEELSIGELTVDNVIGGGVNAITTGTKFYMDPVNGSDGNTGRTTSSPKKTLAAAYALLTTNKNDILYVMGGASAIALTAVFTWAKSYTHLIGITAPICTGGRVRITNTITTATAGEFLITGVGCIFKNIHWQWGGSATATSVVGVALSGDGRNYFENCHFEGPVNATVAGGTAIRMLTVTSSQDNSFKRCTFGARTILSASAAGAIVSFNGTNNNGNTFEDCMFLMYNSTTTSAAVNFVNNAMQDSGFTMFRGCTFLNCVSANIADTIRFTTGAHGTVILQDCGYGGLGTLLWATNLKTTIFITNAVGAVTGGVGINPT